MGLTCFFVPHSSHFVRFVSLSVYGIDKRNEYIHGILLPKWAFMSFYLYPVRQCFIRWEFSNDIAQASYLIVRRMPLSPFASICSGAYLCGNSILSADYVWFIFLKYIFGIKSSLVSGYAGSDLLQLTGSLLKYRTQNRRLRNDCRIQSIPS